MTKNTSCSQISDSTEALKDLLEQGYGDGTIYLYSKAQRSILERAQRYGYVSMEGQITPDGLNFLLRSEK